MAKKTRKVESAEGELTPDKILAIEADFHKNHSRYISLLEEVHFILVEKIKAVGLKIHDVERRVKELRSLLSKCKRDGINALSDLDDIVGARVICLFRSDMDIVGKIIRDNFEVSEVDDKLSHGNNPLGYLSVHYSCKMPSHYKGPRYENTAGISFEIQVRTLCMPCWAAVSHYLDYKGEWDVPADLKRSLSALGGLFYVADSEFEQFYSARTASQQKANTEIEPLSNQEINLDTMTAYLMTKFSDRVQSDSENVSKLIHQLKAVGYKSMAEVDRDVDRAAKAFAWYEKDVPPVNELKKYFAVGVVRISLNLVSEEFRQIAWSNSDSEGLAQYRSLLE